MRTIMRARIRGLTLTGVAPAMVAALALVLSTMNATSAQERSYQERFMRGQNIAPAFEGWEANPDGSFNMVFGYFNRNWEEQPDTPVGPNNTVEPGGPEQGQPTHFFPRRNQFVFRVQVPKDFGQKELVWTLAVHGKTEKAYATLKPEYALDDGIIQRNYSNGTPPRMHENKRPVVRVDGDRQRTVKVGEPLALTAYVTDDGLLKARPAGPGSPSLGGPGYNPALGLRVAWFVYRGPADKVTFDPEQLKVYQDVNGNSPWRPGWVPPPLPADGKFPVRVTFGVPGTFVVRVMAHDGLAVTEDVIVTVTPSSSASAR